MKGKLYIVATPIGNKEDITLRAISILENIDIICAEDTRVTSKLLKLLNIPKKQLISINEYSTENNIQKIISLINEGNNIAYVSDAGTPGVSDPGAVLVNMCRDNDIDIIPIPGVSAITAAISVSGIRETPFIFYGFLPHKNGRKKILNELLSYKQNIILYESVHRFLKLLSEIKEIDINRQILICREITKIYEEIKFDNISNIEEYYLKNKDKIKGEFVIIIKNT